jgi:hypothetical protein
MIGTWSTIYDQAFKIELENGLRFLANFKYTIKPNISSDPINDGFNKFVRLNLEIMENLTLNVIKLW